MRLTLPPSATSPARLPALALALAACSLLAGCPKTESDALLVPGATWLCGTRQFESCRFGFARSFGGEIVVSTLSTEQAYGGSARNWTSRVFVGTDGVAWAEYVLEENYSDALSFPNDPPAIFKLGDDYWALVRYGTEAYVGGYGEYLVRLVDWKPEADKKVFGWWGPAFQKDGRIHGVEQALYSSLSGLQSFGREWHDFNPLTRTIERGGLPVPETDLQMEIRTWAPTASATGPKLYSLAIDDNRLCRVEVAPSGFYTFVYDCVPRSALPAGITTLGQGAMRWGPYGLMMLLGSEEHWWAAGVSPAEGADPHATVRDGVLRLADLGAGRAPAYLNTVHAPGYTSRFWAVGQVLDPAGSEHPERVVRVKKDLSLEAVDVPATPCTAKAVDEGLCAFVYVADVVPLGGDSYLAIYGVGSEAPTTSGGTIGLVALNVVVPPSSEDVVPAGDAGTEPPPGEPLFGEQIEACSHGAACGWFGYPELPGYEGNVAVCAASLLADPAQRTAAPGNDAVKLLQCSGAAASCREFALCMNGNRDEAYCAAHPGGSCDGATAVTCPSAGGLATSALECSATGNQCWVVQGVAACGVEHPCPGPGDCIDSGSLWTCAGSDAVMGTAWKCPAGTTCQYSSGSPLCAGSQACFGWRCEGEVYVGCLTVGGTSYQQRTDCARYHAVCSPTGCVASTEAPCAGADAACVGDEWRACVQAQRVSFDCKAHGFARCGQDSKGYPSCLY